MTKISPGYTFTSLDTKTGNQANSNENTWKWFLKGILFEHPAEDYNDGYIYSRKELLARNQKSPVS